jgi:hypothetical protein
MKLSPLGAELFHADRRTDMTKRMVAFRNFADAPKPVVLVADFYSKVNSWKNDLFIF